MKIINNKYFPTFVVAFAIGIINIIPVLKNLVCFFILPLGIYISFIFSAKLNKTEFPIKYTEGVIFGIFVGLFTSLWSSFFEIVIIFFTRSHDMLNNIPYLELTIKQMNLDAFAAQTIELLKHFADEIRNTGFSFLFSLFLLFNYMFSYLLFGIIASLILTPIINKKYGKT